MKNIKIITLTFVFTLVLCVAGSVYGALLLSTDGKAQIVVPQPVAQVDQQKTKAGCLSVSEQIAKGYKYDICTGEKLPNSFSPDQVEARFQAIEARLNKLEAKK